MITTNYKPRLGACVFSYDATLDTLLVRKGESAFKVDFREKREDDFWKIKKYLSGYYTVQEIASISQLNIEEVLETIECLHDAGLLATIIDEFSDRIEGRTLGNMLRSSISMWRVHMLQHELFRALESGDTPKEVLVGLVLETYYSVSAAPELIGTAISYCKNERHLQILKKLYDDESKHDLIIREAVNNIGINTYQLTESCPLSSTSSLLYFKKELARTDSLLFLVCFSFSEARQDDSENARSLLSDLAIKHGYKQNALDPIFEHMDIDLKAGHSEIMADVLDEISYMEEERVSEIVNQIHLLKVSG